MLQEKANSIVLRPYFCGHLFALYVDVLANSKNPGKTEKIAENARSTTEFPCLESTKENQDTKEWNFRRSGLGLLGLRRRGSKAPQTCSEAKVGRVACTPTPRRQTCADATAAIRREPCTPSGACTLISAPGERGRPRRGPTVPEGHKHTLRIFWGYFWEITSRCTKKTQKIKITSRGYSCACFKGWFWRVFKNNLRNLIKITFEAKDSLKRFLG